MIIITREGAIGAHRWKHHLLIRDARVDIFEMEPAVLGWNLKRITVQGAEAWPDMTAEQILAWKRATPDEHERQPTAAEREFVLSMMERNEEEARDGSNP